MAANTDATVHLDHSSFSAETAMSTEPADGMEIKIDHCIFVSAECLNIELDEATSDGERQGRSQVTVSNSVLMANIGVYCIDAEDSSTDTFKQFVRFSGNDNLYSGPILARSTDQSVWIASIESWTSFSNEENTTQVANLFQRERSSIWEAREQPEFRIRTLRPSNGLSAAQRSMIDAAGPMEF